MCAAQAQTNPQIQAHAHLKSSRQRARVDGQVHLVAHIHNDSLDTAWPRWPRSPVPLGKVVGFFCAGGHCLCIQTPRAQIVLSRTCLGTEQLDRGGVNCSVLVRAETSTSLCASVVERVFWQQCAAFVNVVVSMFSALEAGAGALTSRAQKMFPTTHKFETLMLSNCTSPHICRERLGAGDWWCVHPKVAHRTCRDRFDFRWLLVARVHSLLLLHTLCRESDTIWCICRRVLQGSRICKHMFTCSSLRHIRFCGEEAHLDCTFMRMWMQMQLLV